jgi:GNAT superfamily N-acetyltransferase
LVIRRADWHDIPDLVRVAEQMVEESPEWESFDEKAMEITLESIFRGGGAAFVSQIEINSGTDRAGVRHVDTLTIGAAVAFLTTRPFSGERFVADLAVWVRPEQRGSMLAARLVATLESWARDEGAVEIQLGVSSGIHPGKTGALYESLGYTQSATVFVKKL